MLAATAAAVREGRVDPLDLVDEALRRIEALDPDIGAVVTTRAEEARREAAVHPRSGALAGVPVLVKELNPVAGMRSTGGGCHLHLDDPVAPADAPVVARLRAAGAIVVGLTNTPVFGYTAVTHSPVHGSTRNPWNLKRSPGGSSGGSAAALAAGMVPLATTTDGGGSVRIPASLCGLVGYKPTMGAIGRSGAPRWISFSTNGATNARVADVVLEAEVCFGPVAGDLLALPPGAVALAPARPGRVLLCRTFRADMEPAVASALDRTASVLSGAGLPVEEVPSPFGLDAAMDWFRIGCAELAQSVAWARDRWDGFEPGLRTMLEYGEAVSLGDYLASQRRRYEHTAVLDEMLGDDAVLLLPTVNSRAWMPEGPMADRAGAVVDDPSIAVNTPEMNLTGHPAVSVPMGIGDDGVPLGAQVVAPRWRDGLALGVAELLEHAQPWPLVAPGYEPFAVVGADG